MSSERCKSSLIFSSQVNLGLTLLLLPSTFKVSTTLTGVVICLLFTCPNHQNRPSFNFSTILATSNFSLKPHFLLGLTLYTHTFTSTLHLCYLHLAYMCFLDSLIVCPIQKWLLSTYTNLPICDGLCRYLTPHPFVQTILST
ncbi:hypothetical protein Hanom_Chr10g00967311 [Helianthus anomalus]